MFIDYDDEHDVIIYFQLYYDDACFCLLKLNICISFQDNTRQETDQCTRVPLVPQVNML